MAYWLLKSEPSDYSYDDLEGDGRARWDGVRNAVALKHMRRVKKGDEAFFYHTGSERAIVAIATVESDAYPDPAAEDEKIVVFDVAPGRRLQRPVTLSQIKESGSFDDWELVRIPRLSVMPVPAAVWSAVKEMAEG